MRVSDRFVVLGVLTILVLIVLGAATFLLIPNTWLQDRLVLIDLDRTVRPANPWLARFVKTCCGVCGAVCLLAAALIVANFDRVLRYASNLGKDVRAFRQQIQTDVERFYGSGYRWEVIGVLALLVLGFAMRLGVFLNPMSFDESTTFVLFASRSLLDVLSDYSTSNNHIFHTLLSYLSTKIFGVSPVALRLPAFVAGLLIIPLTYWLMKRLFNANTALLAAGLVAVGPPIVEYSTQARGYTLQTLFFLAGFNVASYLRERSTITGWAVFIAVFAFGLHTVPTMLYGLAFVAVWMFITAARGQHLRTLIHLGPAMVAIGAGALLLYLLPIMRTGLPSTLNLFRIPWADFPEKLLGALRTIRWCWTGYLHYEFVGLLVLGFVAAVFPLHKRGLVLLILIAMLAGTLPLMIVQQSVPPPRIFNFLFPIFAGLCSFGLSCVFGMLRFNQKSTHTLVWIIIVTLISGGWSYSRLRFSSKQTGYPGFLGTNCCGEGFFADAPTVAEQLRSKLNRGDVLVAREGSGFVETTRFYLMMAGLSPTLVHPYDLEVGLGQLIRYPQLYVVVRRSNAGGSGELLQTLGCSLAEFDEFFHSPKLLEHNLVTDLYQLKPRNPPARAPTVAELSSNIDYVW